MSGKQDPGSENSSNSLEVLVADDDPISLRILQGALEKWGHPVVAVKNGNEAWHVLSESDRPSIAVLDWMMPGMDGVTICRKVRARPSGSQLYLILLTARTDRLDVVEGLDAGADDYVTKPFHHAELRARVGVGVRVVELQKRLADRAQELELLLNQVKQLRGLLPICMYCKRIRNDQDYWQQVETYIVEHSEAAFSHGICPECYEKMLSEQRE